MISVGIKSALHRVGETVQLQSPQGILPFLASVQPALKLQGEDSSPLGIGRNGQAVLYALTDGNARFLKEGDCIQVGCSFYRVLQVETRRVGGVPLYIWASLQQWEAEP